MLLVRALEARVPAETQWDACLLHIIVPTYELDCRRVGQIESPLNIITGSPWLAHIQQMPQSRFSAAVMGSISPS